jgi:two-component system chemotaxis response regulator CheY
MGNPKSLLVVDDSRLTRMIIIKLVTAHFSDWKITEATNAKEALECVDRELFDFISLDHNMPDATGYDILPHINATQPLAHIGVFTANIQTVVRKRFEDLGATFYGKPINEAMILQFTNRGE